MTRTIRYSIATLGMLACAAGCVDEEFDDPVSYTTYPYDYYSYAYYYPTDVMYSDPYYTDVYYGYPYYYSDPGQALTDTSGHLTGSVLRALAAGEDVCPGQVSIVPKMTAVTCGGDENGELRTGAVVTFSGCALESGATIDGAIDIDSRHSFSDDACTPDTVVSVTFSSEVKALNYTAPDGSRLVIPSQTSVGSYTRSLSARPISVSLTASGSFESYDSAGALLTQVSVNSSQGVVVAQQGSAASYSVYGVVDLEDLQNGGKVTIKGTNVVHEDGCCHPTSGTLQIISAERTSVLEFGPSCGLGVLDDQEVELPACP